MEFMEFDGIESVRSRVQRGQSMENQIARLQTQLEQLGGMVQQLTGEGRTAVPKAAVSANSLARAQKNAQKATMTAYGEKLASRARAETERSKCSAVYIEKTRNATFWSLPAMRTTPGTDRT